MEPLHLNAESRWLGRYELIGEIACGGMARVLLARLAGVGGFQRLFAIKRLHDHLADDAEFIGMFLDEARLAACIHHPSVVPILEVGEDDGTYFLVMPYVEGDSVAGLMSALGGYGPERTGGMVPLPVTLRIVLDALGGLHAAHDLVGPTGEAIALVHRDCSPHNVLVGVDGCSRIIDFGVAQAALRLSRTRSGLLKGKLAYMAPEQVRGDRDLDRRCDVFAMGIVLWELFSGRRLFKSESELATLAAVLEAPIPALRDVAPHVPPQLDEVCARALRRDRAERYASAADFACALEAAVHATWPGDTHRAIASAREVAAFVGTTLGSDLAQRRDAVRSWIVRSRPSGLPLPPTEGAPNTPDAAPRVAREPMMAGALEDERPHVAPCYLHGARETWSTAPMVLVRRKEPRAEPKHRRAALLAGAAVTSVCALALALWARAPASAMPDARREAAGDLAQTTTAPAPAEAALIAAPAPAVADTAVELPAPMPVLSRHTQSARKRASAGGSIAPAPVTELRPSRKPSGPSDRDDLVNPYR